MITGIQPVTWQDMLGRAQQMFEMARAILGNPDSTAEDLAKVVTVKTVDGKLVQEPGPLVRDAHELKARALALQGVAIDARDALALLPQEPPIKAMQGPSGFKDWSDYLGAVMRAYSNNPAIQRVDPRLMKLLIQDADPTEQKDMSEAVGADGGFLVPAEVGAAQLYAVLGERSIVRPYATIIPMRRRQRDIMTIDQTTTTAGQPHWFGGMLGYWEEEAEQKEDTTPHFRKIQLVAHKIIGYTRASDELVEDSIISLDDFLSGPLGFAGLINWMEDHAFLQGTGAGQPLGVLLAGATIVEPRAAAGLIGFDDLADMMEDFLPIGRGRWGFTQSAMSGLIQLNGPAGNPSYIWVPNAQAGVPGYMLGLPVTWTEKLPLLGNQGDALLADWSYYLVGDRKAVSIESTKFDRWRYDQTSWRVVHRVDGQPWLSTPLTLQDGTTQVSPFVILGGVGGS